MVAFICNLVDRCFLFLDVPTLKLSIIIIFNIIIIIIIITIIIIIIILSTDQPGKILSAARTTKNQVAFALLKIFGNCNWLFLKFLLVY